MYTYIPVPPTSSRSRSSRARFDFIATDFAKKYSFCSFLFSYVYKSIELNFQNSANLSEHWQILCNIVDFRKLVDFSTAVIFLMSKHLFVSFVWCGAKVRTFCRA